MIQKSEIVGYVVSTRLERQVIIGIGRKKKSISCILNSEYLDTQPLVHFWMLNSLQDIFFYIYIIMENKNISISNKYI